MVAEKAGARALPDRADLDPAEIPLLLPYILISEVEQPFRIRYRLIGTEVVHVTGMNFTGHYLDELIPAGRRGNVAGALPALLRNGRPALRHHQGEDIDRRRFRL